MERLCDRVSIIRAGRIVESGTLAQLRHLTRTEVSFDITGGVDLADLPGAHDVQARDGRASFTIDSDRIADVLPAIARLGASGLRVAPPSLEELFLRRWSALISATPTPP